MSASSFIQSKGELCFHSWPCTLQTFRSSLMRARRLLQSPARSSLHWGWVLRFLWGARSTVQSRARSLALRKRQCGLVGVVAFWRRRFPFSEKGKHGASSVRDSVRGFVGFQVGHSIRFRIFACCAVCACCASFVSTTVGQTPSPPPMVVTIWNHDPALYAYDADSDSWSPYLARIEAANGQQTVILCMMFGILCLLIVTTNVRL